MGEAQGNIWLVYDGECPLCNTSAKALKIRQAVGELHLINAREPHPILEEINQAGLNIDKGMVVKFQATLYHGADAQHLLAMISTNNTWFNRLNVLLFRSKFLAKLLYPLFRGARNMLLKLKKTPPINNLASQPLFKSMFGEDWEKLPPVLRKHYMNRSHSNDVVEVVGKMKIACSGKFNLLLPVFKLFHMLVPYPGEDIPVKVFLRSDPNSSKLYFDRIFYVADRKPYRFNSYMQPVKDHHLVEFIFLGIGWQAEISLHDNKLLWQFKGYVLKLFGKLIPLPLKSIFGTVQLEQEAISDNQFHLKMEMIHPLLGKYLYEGDLTVGDLNA